MPRYCLCEERGGIPAPRSKRHTPRNWRCNPETRAGSQFCRGDTEKIKWRHRRAKTPGKPRQHWLERFSSMYRAQAIELDQEQDRGLSM